MTTNHRVAILRSLASVGDFLIPENTLFADANLRLGTVMTITEFRMLMGDMEAKRRVVSARDEDGNLKWKITENGRARLAELVT